jgi:hypothetical protein
MSVSPEEVEAAIAGLGFTRVAATSDGRSVSESDLRTDVRGALEAFLTYVTTEGLT